MKRKVIATLLMSLFLVVLAGCGGDQYADSEYVGEWEAVSAEMSGISITPEEMGMEVYFEFDAGGTATITTVDEAEGEDSASDPWEPTEDGLKITSGDEELQFKKVKDGVITGEFSGVLFTFEKTADAAE